MEEQDPKKKPLLPGLKRRVRKQQQLEMKRNGSHVVHIDDESPNKNSPLCAKYSGVDRELQIDDHKEKILRLVAAEELEALSIEVESGSDVNVVDAGQKTTALHIAAKKRNEAMLKLLLNAKANINAQDNTGHTPLHLATHKGNVACCRVLLDSPNINVNLWNMENNSALHDAAKDGMKDICHMILSHKDANINAKNKKGLTALHFAARENHPQVLKLLMDKGADWNIQDKISYLPIHYAALKGFPECCQVLVNSDGTRKEKQLTNTVKDGKTAMMLAAKNGHHQCVMELFSNVDARDKDGNTALHYAASAGYENTVRDLLDFGSNPNILNKNGCPPVLEAASKKKMITLNALYEKGAKLDIFDKNGKGVLHYAAEKNAEECMKFLLDIEDVKLILDRKEKNHCTAFHLAIKKKSVECALLLLEKGASATEQCDRGMTPLHLAAGKGITRICEKLLARREVNNSSQDDEKKATPLHLAAMHGSVDVCQMLLRKGARLTAKTMHGRTALHVACNEGHANVVKLLSKGGVSMTLKDDQGSTALHLAAAFKGEGALECCKVLISSCKALIWYVDRHKLLPLDRAFENENDQIFEYLLNLLTLKNKQNEWQLRLHNYMDLALDKKRMVIVEAIICSEWWKAGFAGNEQHQCFNFRILLESYPDLALQVQEKCVVYSTGEKSYDFRLYNENCFFTSERMPLLTATLPLFPGFALAPNRTGLSALVAGFGSSQHIGVEWKKEHPLEKMVSHSLHQNLNHPLTKAWLLQKWQSHIYYIFLGLLLLELGFVACLIGYMACVDNWNHIKQRCNYTDEEFTSAYEKFSSLPPEYTLTPLDAFHCITENVTLKLVMWAIVLIATMATLLLELNYVYRLRWEYFSITGNIIRVPRLLFSIVTVLPMSCTSFKYMVQDITQWQFGVAAVLLAWLHLINTLNELPMFSVFMPITKSFIQTFFKVLFYIVMLVFVFAFIFHLLLGNQDAFKSINQAMVKTTVWMIGDLAYDDTFLKPEHLFYPIMVNLLFLVFVTVIGGFIVNLIITQPSNILEDFREKASFHLAARRVALFLRIEVCFPWLTKNTVNEFIDRDDYKHQNFLTRKLLMLDTKAEAPETSNSMQLQLEEQSKQINSLITLQCEQKEENQELRHQLKILVNKTLNEDGEQKHQNSVTKKLLRLDTTAEAPDTPNPMQIQMEEQSKQINTLLTLQYEQKEENQELRHQLKILVNKISHDTQTHTHTLGEVTHC